MRVVHTAVAALIGLACALIGARADAAGASLVLNPARGNGLTAFTAVYHYPAAGGGCPAGAGFTRVVFTWDGRPLGQAQLARQTCRAQLRLRPPRNDRAPGQHVVAAVVNGDAGSRASASYVVEVAPSRGATPPRAATPSPATPAGEGTTTPEQPEGSVAPAVLGSVAASPTAAGDEQSAWVGWTLAFGAILVLAGAGTLGLAIVRSRRERVDQWPPDPSDPRGPGGFAA